MTAVFTQPAGITGPSPGGPGPTAGTIALDLCNEFCVTVAVYTAWEARRVTPRVASTTSGVWAVLAKPASNCDCAR